MVSSGAHTDASQGPQPGSWGPNWFHGPSGAPAEVTDEGRGAEGIPRPPPGHTRRPPFPSNPPHTAHCGVGCALGSRAHWCLGP